VTAAPAPPPLDAGPEGLLRRMRLPHMRAIAPEILAVARAQRWVGEPKRSSRSTPPWSPTNGWPRPLPPSSLPPSLRLAASARRSVRPPPVGGN
jgi:hypothetical protein